MSEATETGFISIVILSVILCIFKVRLATFGICLIAVMHFNFISCDTHE